MAWCDVSDPIDERLSKLEQDHEETRRFAEQQAQLRINLLARVEKLEERDVPQGTGPQAPRYCHRCGAKL